MAETRYISPKTGWKAKPLQAAGDNGDFLQTDVPPKGLACARSLSRYDQLIEGLTVQREMANRGQTSGNQRKGVIDRKLTKDVKHDIILKKLYQQYLKHM